MKAAPIDPRDTRWEVDEPAYRVFFWDRRGDGWASSEWRLTDVDVAEALAWAHDHAMGRRITIWVEHHDGTGLGMIRLAGWEPTRSEPPPSWVT